ncbi:MAG: MATE family efflux transporter, partial [Rhodobacteraceae bacterium]|nr:MATE family efflux transporter [Paracoccaceae bacterium]
RNAMLVTLGFYAPALVELPQVWGNDGLWLAMLWLFVVRAVTLGRLYPGIERGIGAGAVQKSG